mmetsp:Transcript_12482/g.26421  ORF Transcript_12482/g.26421 Transcript_12482/m.26421 type:complete len:262 (+) Transcript_12482:15-800(+)
MDSMTPQINTNTQIIMAQSTTTTTMNGSKRRRRSLEVWKKFGRFLLAIILTLAAASFGSGFSGIGVKAFAPRSAITRSPNPRATTLEREPSRTRQRRSTFRNLSNNSNNDEQGLLARRFERANKTEIRNDATLVACYVLCRFLVYDITSGAKIEPGWEIQDWIWLTGTLSSATVLVIYYTVAGLLSRSFETSSSVTTVSSPIVRALVNVALSCPVWLATEHLLGFGPPDIGGDTLSVAVATGFVGFGSFLALAKTLTAGIR